MLLSLRPGEIVNQDGFKKRVLEDGRNCLLWARGYFFDSRGRMWLGDEIVDWLVVQLGTNQLPDLVPKMNGCICVIVVWPEDKTVEVGIDRFGMVPIYYNIGNSSLIIGDNFWQIASGLPAVQYDPEAILSMVILGFVAGYRTPLTGVAELPQAATHRFSFADDVPELVSQRYWMLSYRVRPQRKSEEWRDELAQRIDAIFVRYAKAILDRGWNLHIPLSGGKDSRLLAGMFSRKGVPVQAFSYGPSGNAETQCASQVAAALGIPLRFVPISGPSFLDSFLIQKMTKRVGMRARFSAGLGGQLSLAAFSEQDVYVPGHTGDFVTGGHLRRGALLVRSQAQAVRHLLDVHSLFVLDELGAPLLPGVWDAASRMKVISSGWHFDADDPIGSIERWDCINRQRRLILSELRTYERFGKWMLPYFDYDLFDFFAEVPLQLRYQQRLYIDTLLHKIFVDDLGVLAQIPIAYQDTIRLPSLSWPDSVLMTKPAAIFRGWLLKLDSALKRRAQLRSIGTVSPEPVGPDPLDHWWYHYPPFRRSIIDTFSQWDGMHGIINVSALITLLQQPLPRLFIQFTVPAFLTLCYFQWIVEHTINAFVSQDEETGDARRIGSPYE